MVFNFRIVMRYENFNYSDKWEILKLLKDNKNVIEVIIGAVNNIDDQEWLEKLCLKYILNDDFGISRAAIYSIGDIARIFGNLLNRDVIEEKFAQVKDEKLKYVIFDVKSDFEIFLKD